MCIFYRGSLKQVRKPVLAGRLQEVVRPLCAVTSSSHRVPGGQLSFQPVTAGNDRIGVVPLERWDVEVAPADNQAGEYCRPWPAECWTC